MNQLQALRDKLNLANTALTFLNVLGQIKASNLRHDHGFHIAQTVDYTKVGVAAVNKRTH